MCPYLSVRLHHYWTYESFAVSSVWSHRADRYVIANTVALERNVIFLGSRGSNPQRSKVKWVSFCQRWCRFRVSGIMLSLIVYSWRVCVSGYTPVCMCVFVSVCAWEKQEVIRCESLHRCSGGRRIQLSSHLGFQKLQEEFVHGNFAVLLDAVEVLHSLGGDLTEKRERHEQLPCPTGILLVLRSLVVLQGLVEHVLELLHRIHIFNVHGVCRHMAEEKHTLKLITDLWRIWRFCQFVYFGRVIVKYII